MNSKTMTFTQRTLHSVAIKVTTDHRPEGNKKMATSSVSKIPRNNIGSPAPNSSRRPMSTPVTPPRTNAFVRKHKRDEEKGSWNHHLSVDKKVVDELLLVCGVIGSTVDPNTGQMLPVEDCINWLQDLQRALRRDEDAYRPISLLLGQWKVVEQKLLPLVLSCRYNTPLLLTVVKILVILTKPLSPNAMKAGKLVINTKKTEEAVIKEQIKLRDNAMAQASLLTEYKKLIVHHPSHRRSKKGSKGSGSSSAANEEGGGILSIFVSLLAEPLSQTGHSRSSEDHHTIELILHLFRNLLCAGEPILKDKEKTQTCAILHQQLIGLFEREMVLDFLLVIGQEMESRENKQYNLLLMEILHHMLKNQDPTLVARSVIDDTPRGVASGISRQNKKTAVSERFRGPTGRSGGGGILSNQLRKERQRMQASSSSRHSHFGGTLVVQKSGGQQRYISATATQRSDALPLTSPRSAVNEKKKSKKHQYFVGSGRNYAIYTRHGIPTTNSSYISGPASRIVQQSLHNFCKRFMTQCYGPVMKSLKNEFRRDSSRLESQDKVIFFRIVWFFCQWRRIATKEGAIKTMQLSEKTENGIDLSKSVAGQLIFTMDVFTFNMVLTSGDFFHEHKKHSCLAQSVALYVEMMHLLFAMHNSSDSTEQIMAMGLMDKLFYQSEPIDRLPKLLSNWTPATFTREYLCDLIELTHVTTKLLECNAKVCKKYREEGRKKKKKKKAHGDDEPIDAITRMRTAAAHFELDVYLARKLISNQTVFMFTQLLSQFDINAICINDHIISFFVRLCKFVVASDEDEDLYSASFGKGNPKKVTLEPMLFNMPLLIVVNDILNDSSLRNNRGFDPLLNFASTIVRHFARECEKNPMLHVEIFFKHTSPHRFCENVSNLYLTDELKMIVERDMLIEQSRQEDDDMVKAKQAMSHPYDEDEEEEMEFNDDNEIQQKTLPSSKDSDSNSDDEEEDRVSHGEKDKQNSAPRKRNAPDDMNAIEKELDEDEERWNDRRSFVPKRKKLSLASGHSSDEEDNLFLRSEKEGSESTHTKTNYRTLLEDSDDEDISALETQPRRLAMAPGTVSRQFLDDSDDE